MNSESDLFGEQKGQEEVRCSQVRGLPYPRPGPIDDGMIARRCSRLLVAVIPVVCLGVTIRAAESDGRNPDVNRSQARAAEISATIRAKLPKYQPSPAQDEATMEESGEAAVERDGVLKLPTVTVQVKKSQSLGEYEMLTPKGRSDMAVRRRPGLRIGNFLGLNNGIALAMLREDIEKEKRDAMKERVDRLSLDDGPDTRELKRLLKEAIARPNTDWMKGRSGR